ncbi:MAG TPA: methyltransferase domain-containing protein [Candidatus Polarisedimenticolaceae bacterium]|nr:methyltransferase domain-containing protein [Candidatus Polarisedimenticolaceae bacterium]
MTGATRLQLGTSRLEHLDRRVLDAFADPSWIHLGDAEPAAPAPLSQRLLEHARRGPLHLVRGGVASLRARSHRVGEADAAALYRRTDFRSFYFRKGDRLSFPDGSFHYVFSEHFLHHLFFDEAHALLRECFRILAPGGVLRTVVPDADLRTYEPPEPAGFPDPRMPFTAPLKHKTRYSVYLLAEALRLAGFRPVPLRFCDRDGNYVRHDPGTMHDTYAGCPEKRFVFELDHVMRLDSLIVDGVREG